jgi:ATP-dependent RNA helicase SUPV3L1/SUV3
VLYRTAGYRVCGERAVRVDILERLADLIRPALAWREGVAGPKPPGAVAGGGFTVVNGMTSLTGASGEDFASILRALGYRMERRPKPAEPAPAEPKSQTDAKTAEIGAPAHNGVAETDAAPVPSAAAGGDESKIAETTDVSAAVPHVATPADHETVLQPTAELLTVSPATDLPTQSLTNVAAEPADEAVQSGPAEETAMIEVWRPGRAGRPEGRRRRRFSRREAGKEAVADTPTAAPQRRDDGTPAVAAPDAASSPPAAESAEVAPSKPQRHPRYRRRHAGEHRGDRPQRERERGPVKPARFERREREKAPDPNSPFAKLATLKAQLEADAKERR